jgi:hypothetical protein
MPSSSAAPHRAIAEILLLALRSASDAFWCFTLLMQNKTWFRIDELFAESAPLAHHILERVETTPILWV